VLRCAISGNFNPEKSVQEQNLASKLCLAFDHLLGNEAAQNIMFISLWIENAVNLKIPTTPRQAKLPACLRRQQLTAVRNRPTVKERTTKA